jgi:hypothetical protein
VALTLRLGGDMNRECDKKLKGPELGEQSMRFGED